MKIFNVAKEKIKVDRASLMQAINGAKEFAITISGEILYPPYHDRAIYIYKGVIMPISTSGLSMPKSMRLQELFHVGYKLEEEGESVIFDVANAWNVIVPINIENATFDDTTSDGIMDLYDPELEEMSWHGIEWGITNREISDVIEEKCDGTLFCYHTESPFMFSSLVYIDDMACAREKVKEMIVETIKEKLAHDPEFAVDSLSEDEEEAAKYFGVL
jgi:hypothetical protein